MKAVVYTSYGPPGVLRLTDVPTPVPKDNEVLVRVAAVSINPVRWSGLAGNTAVLPASGPVPGHGIQSMHGRPASGDSGACN